MDEKQVFLAKIICECPKCDKLFEVKRYVEQFKPIDPDTCRVVCIECNLKSNHLLGSQNNEM